MVNSIQSSAFTYTIVTCHFGDIFWISHSLRQIDKYSDSRIEAVIVVDQSRVAADALTRLPRVTKVLSFPKDESQIEILGHDHPAALNQALAALEIKTSHIIILDSDCFPVDSAWLDKLRDVTMASDPSKWGLSHPCFMAFPVRFQHILDFAEGLREVGLDTGRLVGLQVARTGTRVWFTSATPAFDGYKGDLYLSGSIYHHGSASLAAANIEQWMSGIRVDRYREKLFRRKVEYSNFEISPSEKIVLQFRRVFRGVTSRLHKKFTRSSFVTEPQNG